MNNGKRQSAKNVFRNQTNSFSQTQTHGDVVQDKGRISSAHTGTKQPAPHQNPMRPHGLNTEAARSKNKPKPKRKTIHLTLWVDPIVKRELQRVAELEGLTVSKTGVAFLKQALQQNVDMHYSALLTLIIETAIDKHRQTNALQR
jgi:hypothetical protein